MALRDLLTLTSVQVNKDIVTPDGLGGSTTTTTTVTLKYAALWSPGQSARYISDRMARTSSHILVTEPAEYTFDLDDDSITYEGQEYEIAGPSDDVMNLGEILVTPLNRIK